MLNLRNTVYSYDSETCYYDIQIKTITINYNHRPCSKNSVRRLMETKKYLEIDILAYLFRNSFVWFKIFGEWCWGHFDDIGSFIWHHINKHLYTTKVHFIEKLAIAKKSLPTNINFWFYVKIWIILHTKINKGTTFFNNRTR